MKKITAFFMVMILCVFAFGMTVSAEGEPTITVSSATAPQGDEVILTVDIANNPGIAMLELPISYDDTRLEKVEFVASGLPGGYVNTTGVWINAGDSTYNGTILTLKFKVLDNAPLGDAAVNVSVKSAANWNEQSVSFTVNGGAVTVTEPVHEHVYGEWVVEKAATCTVNGSKYRICTVAGCAEKQTEVITAPGHSLGQWTVGTDATCAAEGTQIRKCANCDYSESKAIAKKDHVMGEWKVTKAATCTAEGTEARKCTGCDLTETRAIGKKDHVMGEWTVTKAATCTAEGTEARKCTGCDLTETRAIAPKGHNFGDWKADKEATCTQEGSRSRVCADCGTAEKETIPALNHAFVHVHYDEMDHWYTCACGASSAPEAHDFENSGMCACGYQKPVSDNPALDNVPKTGDITRIVATVPLTILAVTACAIIAMILAEKRRNTK